MDTCSYSLMDRVPVFGTGGEGSNPSTSTYFIPIPILICTCDKQKIKKILY